MYLSRFLLPLGLKRVDIFLLLLVSDFDFNLVGICLFFSFPNSPKQYFSAHVLSDINSNSLPKTQKRNLPRPGIEPGTFR